MKIKRFYAENTRTALKIIREEFGPDAVILSNKNVSNGVEVVAAIDFEQSQLVNEPILENKQTTDVVSDKVQWIKDPHLSHIQKELNDLRSLIKMQFTHDKQRASVYKAPQQYHYLRQLHQSGLSLSSIKNFFTQINDFENEQNFWSQLIALMSQQVKTVSEDVVSTPGTYAFIGPTGGGKTTTLAKIAARLKFAHGSDAVGLISTDDYRIGAHDQLKTYGRLMNMDVICTNASVSLDEAITRFSSKKFILVDTSGVGLSDDSIKEKLSEVYECTHHLSHYLVVPAHFQASQLEKTLTRYQSDRLHSVIMSKLDEVENLIPILDFIIKQRLAVSYVTTGQNVPEDIKQTTGLSLVEDAIMHVQREVFDPIDDLKAYVMIEDLQHESE